LAKCFKKRSTDNFLSKINIKQSENPLGDYQTSAGNPSESPTKIDGFFGSNTIINDNFFSAQSTNIKNKKPTTSMRYGALDVNQDFSEFVKENFLFNYDKMDANKNNPVSDEQIFNTMHLQPDNVTLKNTVLPLKISLELEGTAGFSIGDIFNINVLPKIYNGRGYFSITAVDQSIDESMVWTTNLEATYVSN